MPYLIDSDWVIQALRGRQPATSTIAQLLPQGIGISWVTVAEVYEGAFGKPDGRPDPQAQLAHLRDFLQAFRVVALTDPIAERFAQLRADLRQKGQRIPDFDLIIAATALHYDLTILTRNHRHFERIPAVKLYPTAGSDG
jgi:predicted nucleic acid-binding protein